jgi:hypothetical protein
MIRSAASKVMWVGRATVFLVGLAVILALVFGVLSRAGAHTGSVGLFHLGHSNVASTISTLVGTVSNGMLQVTNNATATTATGVGVTNKSTVSPAVRATNTGGGPALGLAVASGKAPMTVNSDAKVAKLNADRIDDREASSFANATHIHSGADITSGTVEADRIEDGAGSNLDADTIDGLDSSQFAAGTSGKANDADKLDGKDSTDFQGSYKRTVVVSPVPNDAVASGTALKNALNGITNASQTNPYLLKIEPGVYDLGSLQFSRLDMKSFVDVEGSGKKSPPSPAATAAAQ